MIGDFRSAAHSNIIGNSTGTILGHTQACAEASGASVYGLKKVGQYVITIIFTKALGK